MLHEHSVSSCPLQTTIWLVEPESDVYLRSLHKAIAHEKAHQVQVLGSGLCLAR